MIPTVHRGADADELLRSPTFRAGWADLSRRCPWATPFQGPDFAVAWYTAYRRRFEPVLIVRTGPDGQVDGILALATDRGRAERDPVESLVVVGAWQAEYQSWVCVPEDAEEFPAQVIDIVRREWPSAGLRFRYLPQGTPLDWVDRPGARKVKIQAHRRPLLRFGDGSGIDASMRKSKNKLRRLKKLGVVELRRLDTVDELDAVLDDVVAHHDTRHLDVHGSADFLDDPEKRPFHRAMAEVDGLLNVTVLTVGGEVASAHLDFIGRDEVHHGVIAHSPWFAAFPTGKFHIYLLARMLLEQGYEQLDLTAGNDQYKWRFANAWDEVHTLDVPPLTSTGRAAAKQVGRVVRAAARRAEHVVLARTSVSPARFRSELREMAHRGVSGAAMALRDGRAPWTDPVGEFRLYRHDLGTRDRSCLGHDDTCSTRIARNRLQDLLGYRPSSSEPSRRRFMSVALRRIEQGQRFYTCAEDGRLLVIAWLAGPSATADPDMVPHAPPTGTVLVHGVHTAAGARQGDLVEHTLRAVLLDVAEDQAVEAVLAAVPMHGTATDEALLASGFRPDPGPSIRPIPGGSATSSSPPVGSAPG